MGALLLHSHYYVFVNSLLESCDLSNFEAVFAADMSIKSSATFQQQKDLLKEFTNILANQGKDNQIGLVSYGGFSSAPFKFSPSFDVNAFHSVVDGLNAVDNGRRVDGAITKAYQEFFKPGYILDGKNTPIGSMISKGVTNMGPLTSAVKQIKAMTYQGMNGGHPNRHGASQGPKLFVLFVAGSQIDDLLSILPRDAARLLQDLGVHILVIPFDKSAMADKKITSITQLKDYILYYENPDQAIQLAINNICKRFPKKGNLL